MKTIITIAVVLLTAAGAYAATLRCAGDFIRPGAGYDSFTVLRKCGEPVHKETIGYKLSGDRSREAKIERWVYGPDNGYFYHLKFVGGKLTELEAVRE